MVVNALVTGLIVFKILKVLLEVEATSIGQTLSSLSSTGGIKLRQIIFMIIESGMALLAIQLVRVVITCVQTGPTVTMGLAFSWDLVITFHQVLNVIITLICSFSTSFVLLMAFTWLGHRSNNNFGAGLNEIVHR